MSETDPLDTVRLGIVGGGFMARVHSLAYRAMPLLYGAAFPKIEQIRLADVNRDIALQAAREYGWREATADWREVTRAPDIDLVDIVTPNDSHAEIAIDAAEHGKHILCEKPLANTVDNARRMYAAATSAGVLTQMGFVFHTWPAVAAAKQLIENGRVGRIYCMNAHYFHDYALDQTFPMGWRVQKNVAGGGSINDLGSHVVDLARYLVGEIAAVTARTHTLIPARPDSDGNLVSITVDDAADIQVDFACGATGVIQTNWMAAGHKTDIGFEILGERAALSFTWEQCNSLRFYDHDDPVAERGFRTIHIGPQHAGAQDFWPVAGQGLGYGDAFTILIARFLKAIASGECSHPDFLDGLYASEIVSTAIRAADDALVLPTTPSRSIHGAPPHRRSDDAVASEE